MKSLNAAALGLACGLVFAKAASADSAVLFPLEIVNTPAETANAVTLVLSQLIESRGIKVVMGKNLNARVTSVPAAAASPSTTPADSPQSESPAAPTQDVPSLSVLTMGAGCGFYLTGSIVTLGEQVTITLDLYVANGARVTGKKITAPNQQLLPSAIETIAAATADEIRRFQATPPAPPPAAVGPDPVQNNPKTNDGFQKNFGLAVSQTFSISKDDMYNFMSFYFNGRFEFNRLLMNTNVGFSLGNSDPEDAFHFLFNLSLAAYLLKTQVTPYLGAGFGFFIGNRMKKCEPDYMGGETCSNADVHVGWDVFPVLGLEVLRNTFLRVHLEGRYLVTFNGNDSWGHGPVVMMGVAF
jgi:hypothetical protein